jgi:pimeloyl-ACP methyl ester carboxylesterase
LLGIVNASDSVVATMEARRFDFNAAVDDVTALLHRLRAAPVALVGLSLGGNIAQEIVYRSPELLDALPATRTTRRPSPPSSPRSSSGS